MILLLLLFIYSHLFLIYCLDVLINQGLYCLKSELYIHVVAKGLHDINVVIIMSYIWGTHYFLCRIISNLWIETSCVRTDATGLQRLTDGDSIRSMTCVDYWYHVVDVAGDRVQCLQVQTHRLNTASWNKWVWHWEPTRWDQQTTESRDRTVLKHSSGSGWSVLSYAEVYSKATVEFVIKAIVVKLWYIIYNAII